MSSDDDTAGPRLRPRRAETQMASQFASQAHLSTADRLKSLLGDDFDSDEEVGDVERLGDIAVNEATAEKEKKAREREEQRKARAAEKAARKAEEKAAREKAAAEKRAEKKKNPAQDHLTQQIASGTQRTLDSARQPLNLDAALAAIRSKGNDDDDDDDDADGGFDFKKLMAAERDDDDRSDEDEVYDASKILGLGGASSAADVDANAPTFGVLGSGAAEELNPEAAIPPEVAASPTSAPAAAAPQRAQTTRFTASKAATAAAAAAGAVKLEAQVKTEPKDDGATPSPQSTGAARNFAVKQEVKRELEVSSVAATASAVGDRAKMGAAAPALLPDGTFEMYWFDAREQPHYSAVDGGSVFLYGKCKATDGSWRSVCLRVRGMQRCVYCLPEPDAAEIDVVKSLAALCQSRGIGERRVKKVDRWYCFEEEDVPRDKNTWFKLRYAASHPPLFEPRAAGEPPVSTKAVKRLFGVNRSLIELFLVKRKFKGPSFVHAKNAKMLPDAAHITHCDIEMVIDSPKDVAPVTGVARIPPPLTAMSIQLHAQLDPVKNANEVFAVALSFIKINPDESTRSLEGVETVCAVRPPHRKPIPLEFAATIKKAGLGNTRTFGNEAALLNWLTDQIKRHDPDMHIGHNFQSFTLDVLLHRFNANRVANWSVLGRLQLRQMPKLQAGAGGTRDTTAQEREVCSGRLIIDTYTLAREHYKTTNYKLVSIARELQLRGLYSNDVSGNVEEQPDLTGNFKLESLVDTMRHCANLSLLAIGLANRLDLVQLTKGLTALAGNLWSRTLTGSRSERIEYLLLQAFHRAKFVTPDKRPMGSAAAASPAAQPGGKGVKRERDDGNAAVVGAEDEAPAAAPDADDDVANAAGEDSGNAAAATKRKAKYQGGMVLEPKTGLYKEYILLLDFNSLYPSIIQEFSICFTTVKRRSGEIPTVPSPEDLLEPGVEPGQPCPHRCVLPNVIRGLVEQRRQVKKMMKTEKDSGKLSQYEIRQKALKLTANSMYGCLGFEYSRFYAQQLAELVTEKGREALGQACEIVEATQLEDGSRLDVVYGDTDSVMIRTQQRDLARVREIAMRVQASVNKRYTKLEIGIDGVFCSMLLHKKKKYAALVIDDYMGEGKKISREVKGLDMVRRDWCRLTKMACEDALDVLLDHATSTDDAIAHVVKSMGEMATKMRAGTAYDLSHFCVSKSLTRDPELYKDANQPHVQVALRMKKRNEQVRTGDIIPYVVCNEIVDHETGEVQSNVKDGNEKQTSSATSRLASRAYHVDEVAKNANLTLDIDWYLSTQILPPVMRLAEHVDGFSGEQLADAMGIVGQYQAPAGSRGAAGAAGAGDAATLALTADGYTSSAFKGQSLEEAFPLIEPLHVPCRHCHKFSRVQPHETVSDLVALEATKAQQQQSASPDGRSGSRLSTGATRRHKYRQFLYRCTFCKSTLDLQLMSNALLVVLHRLRRDFYATGGTDLAREKVRQQLTYFRALFDAPRSNFNSDEWNAHSNVLRLVKTKEDGTPSYHANADESKCRRDYWEDVSNPLLEVATEALEQLVGNVVDTSDLFAGLTRIRT